MVSDASLHSEVRLRPFTTDDLPFLQRLYASTREAELQQTDWNDEQKTGFLQMQFDLQHNYYQQHFKHARFDVVTYHEQDIGRLYIEWRTDELRIIDIAFLPEYRGRGIGSTMLQSLLAQAKEKRKSVGLHVEYYNPALLLYRRFGFREIAENGVYRQMKWEPQ